MIKIDHFTTDSSGNLLKRERGFDKKKNSSWVSVANNLNIGMYIAAPLLVGVFFGLLIDTRFGSKPYGVLGGIGIGSMATFYNLIKIIKTNAEN